MKKLTTLLMFVAVLAFSAKAQYFIVAHPNAGTNPGGLNTDSEYPVGGGLPGGWTTIFTGSTNTANSPSYTASRTIPFAFQFNGSAVTNYKVSTNGIVTFDVAATANPTATNTTIPSASLPDNSVAIWGLYAGGGGDYIATKTFGTAPNRQHWIHFNSYSTAGAGWSYWSIVLEETSNKIYIVDQRTNTGPLTLTLGVQVNNTTAYQVIGSPNVTTATSNGPTPADNSYWEIIPGVQPANDASVSAITVPNPVSGANPISVSGSLINLGSAALTSVEVNWSEVGSSVVNTDTLSFNLPSGGSTTFNHSINWSPTPLGQFHDIEVWTSNPNGMLDGNTANDSMMSSVFVNLGNTVQKNALFEEFTTTSCGWCPDGHLIMDQITATNPNVIPVALHSCFNTDGMSNTESVTICNTLGINSAPTGMVDRKLFPGEQNVAFGRGGNAWVNRCNSQSALGSAADVNLYGNYNSATRNLNVTVDVSFVDYVLPGDIRVSLMLVEDSVTGANSTQFNQRNFYSGNPNFTTHPFYSRPDPIVGYNHRHVLRDILPSTWGDNTVIPGTIALNTSYTRNFNFNLLAGYDVTKLYLVGVVSYVGGNNLDGYQIINAKEVKLNNLVTGIEEQKDLATSLKIYPNPSDLPFTNVQFNLEENASVQARIMDITGKVVATQDFGTMSQGNQLIQLNTDRLENGFYFVNLNVGDQEISRKISILR